MGLSLWHILIVVVLFVLLFGRGKISDLMGDIAQGIKSFKQGIADDQETEAIVKEPKLIHHDANHTPKTQKSSGAKAPRKQRTG